MFLPEPTSNFNTALLLFLQFTIIIVACRLIAWVLRKTLSQPSVVGEMTAGVLLGPSLIGAIFPEFHHTVFPKASLTVIYCIAQIGIVLYMFLVGLEFDHRLVRSRLRSALSVSVAGIVVPFALGCGFTAWHIGDRSLFSESVGMAEAMFFMGAAMSITAFPVLARIIHDRGLTGTSLGSLALAAGSTDDAAAWCILAIVLANMKHDQGLAFWAIGGAIVYVVFVLFVARRWLRRLESYAARTQTLSTGLFSFVLVLLTTAAWFTDSIGIHAVFGGFILGVAMPRGFLNEKLQATIRPIVTALLLPLFFVYSGLNTHIGLISTWSLWLTAGLVLVIATIGKFVATSVAARFNGESWRESLGIGALMNARGLMELIILNIGLDAGLITPTLFSIMVIMAIVTTVMATPLFELVCGRHVRRNLAPSPTV